MQRDTGAQRRRFEHELGELHLTVQHALLAVDLVLQLILLPPVS